MPSPSERVVYRTCPLCEASCGLELRIRGDEVAQIRGDDRDVFSRGYVCPKGATLAALHEDPDRLRRPLVKRGGRHVEVGWDEAFEAVERGLAPIFEQHGRDAVAAYLGNPNVHNLAGSFYLRPVLKALGSKNIFTAATMDQMPKHVSSGLMFGDPGAIPVPDLDRTQHLLMLGANPFESNGSLCTAPDFPGRLHKLRERGGKLVVVDPRRTRTTAIADEHHFIRPGTDALLLVAMIRTLFDDGRADPGSLAEHVVGADDVDRATLPFSPERVAETVGIDAQAIRRMARELAEAESAAVYGRIGTHTTEFGTLASWAVDVLNVLTGNLDSPGGAMFARPAHAPAKREPGGRGFTTGRYKSRVSGIPEVMGEIPVVALAEEIETPGAGQVRGLLTIAGNPVLSAPDGGRLDAALSRLDFVVSVDIYLNETTRHADVILPPPSPLERSHYDLAFYGLAVRNVANYSAPVFEPEGPSEAEILGRLSLVLAGQGADADPKVVDEMLLSGLIERAVSSPQSPVKGRDAGEIRAALGERPGPDRILDLLLRTGPYGDCFGEKPDGLSLERLESNPHGVDFGALEPQVPNRLSTPSAKIELAPAAIIADLPRLEARLEARPGRDENSLLLVGRRHVRSNNSWMHNIERLVRGRGRCTLHVHPQDAEKLGLVGGGTALVSSRVGKVEAPVEVTEDVMPGVVSLPHGWGHDLPGARMRVARDHAGVNSNLLTDGSVFDPLSGNAALNAIPVQVSSL